VREDYSRSGDAWNHFSHDQVLEKGKTARIMERLTVEAPA
jgi:hypothetical protein